VTYNGRLGGTGSHENRLALTKTGTGTFTLTGSRTYTGPTLVETGTLALVGGSHASPITMEAGASLGFTLGTPAISTAAVNLTSGTVKITGTVDNATNYKLMTASSFTGPLVLSQAIPGYSLALQGAGNTELWLVFSDLYEAWSGIGVNFDGDANKDGVEDGLAWFFGAGNSLENAAARLPKPTQNAGGMVLEFDCLNAADRGTAVFEVQYSSDLGQTNTWAATPIPGGAGTFTGGVVDFVITDPEPAGGLLKVVATIPLSEASAGKLFSRIRGAK
jgi:autotransporter-associated beta strand protein